MILAFHHYQHEINYHSHPLLREERCFKQIVSNLSPNDNIFIIHFFGYAPFANINDQPTQIGPCFETQQETKDYIENILTNRGNNER